MNQANPKTILVVDDTPENIELLDGLLSETYRIRLALNGSKALAIAGSEDPPDLILLDIMMPGMDGYEVIGKLKESKKTRDTPVIFLTALSEVTDEARGLSLGAVDYITKPFNPNIVKIRVETHLALATARKTLALQNEELVKAAQLKEDIERINRHDLKTPIGSVIALPEFLLQDDNLTDDQKETLETLRNAGYQMLNMVNSSLDMYKMEQGTYKPRIAPVDVAKLCKTIITELRELATSYCVNITLTLEGEPLPSGTPFIVGGEETLLYSMLANIIKNAIEASPVNETVQIEFRKGEQATIIVHSASTIPEKIRTNFFDKYTTADKAGGTGLGTYSARLIAETLKGAIRFETSDENGTALIATLPYPCKEEKPETVSSPTPKVKREKVDISKLSFLIADDMQNIRMIVKRTLQQAGVTKISTASDGSQAIEKLKSGRFDCIVSDWNMPNVTGLELLQWVRNESSQKDIPFIMVTAERTQEQVVAAAQSGVNGYIVKPFTPQMVHDKLKSVLNC